MPVLSSCVVRRGPLACRALRAAFRAPPLAVVVVELVAHGVQLEPLEHGRRSGAAAFRTFVRIAEVWGLSVEEQLTLLGQPARSTYFRWKKEGAEQLSVDTLERLSYLLGIYKALQILFPDVERADAWLRRPNDAPLFGGRPALDRMLSGRVADLYVVRQYLDAQLGGWP